MVGRLVADPDKLIKILLIGVFVNSNLHLFFMSLKILPKLSTGALSNALICNLDWM